MLKRVLSTVASTFDPLIKDPANREEKSAEKAKEFREAGNKEYSAKKFAPAVKQYTLSVAHAPPGSEALALAFANRSAVFVQMKKFRSALKVNSRRLYLSNVFFIITFGTFFQDIRLSIDANYPTKLRYKLQQRKLQCLLQLGQVDESWEAEVQEYLHTLQVKSIFRQN